ncbi:MAG: tetratricopeptide repeat protein [Bacillota bacterium]
MRKLTPWLLLLFFLVGCARQPHDPPRPTPAPPPPPAAETRPTEPLRKEAADLARSGKLDEAAARLREALALNPKEAATWNDLSFVYIQAKRWAEAVEAAEEALRLEPGNAAAHFNKGRALYGAGRYSEAVPPLEAAYARNQAQVEPGWFLALALERAGEETRALQLFRELRARFPGDADVARELERLEASRAVLFALPEGQSRVIAFLGDLLLSADKEGMQLRATDATGTERWSLRLPAHLEAFAPHNQRQEAVLSTAGGLLWIDLRTGQHHPVAAERKEDPNGADHRLHWRGDTLLWGIDIWGGNYFGQPRYLSTEWALYRLPPDRRSVEPIALLRGGQKAQLSEDGQTLLLQGTPMVGAELYLGGKRHHHFERSGTYHLSPAGDRVLLAEYDGLLALFSRDGRPLWEKQVGPYFSALFWAPTPDQLRVVVSHEEQIRLLNIEGNEIARTAGELYSWEQPRGPLLSLGDRLIDPAGRVVATGEFGHEYSPDGRWIYRFDGRQLRAYRP